MSDSDRHGEEIGEKLRNRVHYGNLNPYSDTLACVIVRKKFPLFI